MYVWRVYLQKQITPVLNIFKNQVFYYAIMFLLFYSVSYLVFFCNFVPIKITQLQFDWN